MHSLKKSLLRFQPKTVSRPWLQMDSLVVMQLSPKCDHCNKATAVHQVSPNKWWTLMILLIFVHVRWSLAITDIQRLFHLTDFMSHFLMQGVAQFLFTQICIRMWLDSVGIDSVPPLWSILSWFYLSRTWILLMGAITSEPSWQPFPFTLQDLSIFLCYSADPEWIKLIQNHTQD